MNHRDLSIEEEVVALLMNREFTITCAESCTGGLLCASLVNVSGASTVLKSSLVTYAEEAKKELLGVRETTLENFGVVSEETALEMAKGAAGFAKADVALSVTGVAGPGGGTEEKPVGLVCIGCYVQGKTEVRTYVFRGDRLQVRKQSVQKALELAKECILKY